MSGEAMYYEYPRVNFYPESDLKKLLIILYGLEDESNHRLRLSAHDRTGPASDP